MKKYLSILLSVVAATSMFAASVSAQSLPGQDRLGVEYGAYTGLGDEDVRFTITQIISVALGLLGIILLVLILYAGFLWMTAAGEEDKIKKAKDILSAAIIGLAIILSAYAITRFVSYNLSQATGLVQ